MDKIKIISGVVVCSNPSPFEYSRSLGWEGCRKTRIIELRPHDPKPPCAIRINLVECDIDQNPEYSAISYCWGGQQPTTPIICNDKLLLITETLALALSTFSKDIVEPLRLWADAICINQSDNEEKNVQVGMMRDIFCKAKKVDVWLGVDSPEKHVKTTFRILDGLSNTIPRSGPTWKPGQPLPWQLLHFQSLIRLFELPWFSRVWVIQEICLCQHAVVHCGDLHIEWEKLYGASLEFLGSPSGVLN